MSVSVIRINPVEGSTNRLLAWADVRITTESGSIRVNGLSVVESPKGGYFVGFPQRASKDGTRWFNIVEVEGGLREEIRKAVMDAYQNGTGNQAPPAS